MYILHLLAQTQVNSAFVHVHSLSPSWPAFDQDIRWAKNPWLARSIPVSAGGKRNCSSWNALTLAFCHSFFPDNGWLCGYWCNAALLWQIHIYVMD